MHRESLSDTNLNAFLRDGALDDKDEVFFKLAHHFELADRNITTDWWHPWNDSIPLRDALHRGGFLKAFEVTRHMRRTNYSFNIYNPAHPIWMASVHQDAWGTSVDRERAELAAALGDMLIPRWRSYDAHQKTLYEENLAMRMLICTGAAFDGAYQSLKGTLNALWEVGKVVLEAAGSMLKAHVQFVTNLTQGEFEKIANDLAQFGLDAGRSVAEFQEKLERGMERLNLILSDGVSRSMIWQFFDGMKESLSRTNKFQIVGAIGRAAKQAIVQASDRVMDFVGDLRKGAARTKPNDSSPRLGSTLARLENGFPSRISRNQLGDHLGSGGNKDVFAFGESQAVGVLKSGKNPALLTEELSLLNELDELGLPTVNARGPTSVDGYPALIFDRLAQGSKDVVRLERGKVRIVGQSSLLNQRSIDDLRLIRNTLVDKGVKVDDLQFLIGRDGRVVIADPLGVEQGASPSKNNLRMIHLLIKSAQGNG